MYLQYYMLYITTYTTQRKTSVMLLSPQKMLPLYFVRFCFCSTSIVFFSTSGQLPLLSKSSKSSAEKKNLRLGLHLLSLYISVTTLWVLFTTRLENEGSVCSAYQRLCYSHPFIIITDCISLIFAFIVIPLC